MINKFIEKGYTNNRWLRRYFMLIEAYSKVEVEEFESNTTPGKMLKSNKIAAYKKIGTSTTGASASPEKPADNGTSAW